VTAVMISLVTLAAESDCPSLVLITYSYKFSLVLLMVGSKQKRFSL